MRHGNNPPHEVCELREVALNILGRRDRVTRFGFVLHLAALYSGGKDTVRYLFSGLKSVTAFEERNHELNCLHNPSELGSDIATVRDVDFIGGYMKRELALQLDLLRTVTTASDFEAEEYSFVFQNVASDFFESGDKQTGSEIKSDVNVKSGHPDEVELSVPINSGAIVEEVEGLGEFVIRVSRIVSNVRLYRKKPIPKLCREWGSVDGVSVEFRLVDADRKFDFILIGGGCDMFGVDRRLIDQRVKSRPQLVKELAKLKRSIIFGSIGETCFSNTFGPLIVHLDHNGMSVRLNELSDFSISSVVMKHRPVESLYTVGEGTHAA